MWIVDDLKHPYLDGITWYKQLLHMEGSIHFINQQST